MPWAEDSFFFFSSSAMTLPCCVSGTFYLVLILTIVHTESLVSFLDFTIFQRKPQGLFICSGHLLPLLHQYAVKIEAKLILTCLACATFFCCRL